MNEKTNLLYPSLKEFNPLGPTSDKGFTINEVLFKKIIKKEGIEGWNTRWKNTPNMERPGGKTLEELNIAIEKYIEVDLNNSDFSGWNLDGIILNAADCRYANFSGVSFKNSMIQMVDFTGSNLTKADFRNTNLSFTFFENTDLSGALFDNTKLICAYFENTNFEGCDFSKAKNLLEEIELLKMAGIAPEKIKL